MTSPQQNGFSLGQAHGQIRIDASGVQSGIQQAQRAFNNGIQSMGQSMQAFGAQVQSLGANLTLLTAPIAAMGVQGVRTAASFQDAMTQIEARTGLTGAALDAVRNQALQLGADTKFSAQQAAEGMLNLLTAGLSVEEAMEALPQVLSAAAAGGMDLGAAATILTNVMTSFGLEATDTTAIVQAMSAAAAASPASMQEIGDAMAAVGGVASNFGISMEETASIMAIFAKNGIRGTEAGTQLRSMLRNMTSDAEPTQEAWAKLGVSMFDAEGNARSLDDVLADMNVSLAGMTQQEQIEILQQLGGAYGQIGLSALLGSDGIDAMTATLGEQALAGDVASTMMNTFNGAMESLGGSIETLMITAFTPFIEMLTPMINQVIEIVNGFSEWADANQHIVQPMLKVLTVIVAIGPILFAVGTAISAFGGILSTMGVALAALTSPIGLVIGAVAALGYAWSTNLMGIRDIMQPIVDTIIQTFTTLMSWFNEAGLIGGIQLLFTTFEDGSNILGNFFEALGFGRESANAIGATINSVVLPAINVFLSVIGQVSTQLGVIAAWIQNSGLIHGLQLVFTTFEDGSSVISGFLQMFGMTEERANTVANAFNSVLLPAFNYITTALTTFVTGTVPAMLTAFFDYLGRIWEVVSPALTQLADWFTVTALPAIAAFITGTVFPLMQDFFNFLAACWELISPALASMFDWFVESALPGIFDFIQNDVYPIMLQLFEFIGNIWTLISPALTSFGNWFLESGLPQIITFISTTATNALNNFVSVIQSIVSAISSAMTDVNNFITATQEGGIGGAINQGASNIGTFFNQVGGALGFAEGGMVNAVVGERGPENVALPVGSQVTPTSGSSMPSIGTMIIQANTEAGGAAAMRGALSEWDKVMIERNFQ